MAYDSTLVNRYFELLGQTGNTKTSSEQCAISVSTGRNIEAQYPERLEEAMFEYREMLRGEVLKRITDPERFSERLLIKELEMVDHRYRTKVEVNHNVNVELVGRLQRAAERLVPGIKSDTEESKIKINNIRTLSLEAKADNRAPSISEYESGEEGKVIDAEFTKL